MVIRVKTYVALAAGVALVGLAGCAGNSGQPLLPFLGQGSQGEADKPAPNERAGCKTTETCAGILRKLVAGKNRDWIGKKQAPEAYDDGTRLFAYRALRRKMSCSELARAHGELREALPTLQGQAHAGSRALMQKIERELGAERRSRCREKS